MSTDPEYDVQSVVMDQGPNREEMVQSFIAKEDEWGAKTALELHDPAVIAALRQFGTIFPQVEDLQPSIDQFLDEFLMLRTSLEGKSRDEIRDILMAMYGKSGGSGGDFGRAFARALGAEDDE